MVISSKIIIDETLNVYTDSDMVTCPTISLHGVELVRKGVNINI